MCHRCETGVYYAVLDTQGHVKTFRRVKAYALRAADKIGGSVEIRFR